MLWLWYGFQKDKPWHAELCLLGGPLMTDIACVFFVVVVDGRVKGDLPLSLHHMAWLWCPRISRLLPSFPLKCSRIWLFRRRAWALRGALQCWDWTLRDLCLGGHLPGPGKGGEGEGLLLNKSYKSYFLIFTWPTCCYYPRHSSYGKMVR